jgi:uncharacterized membrane protein
MVDQIIIDILGYGHVLSAIGWLGGGLLTTFVLGPSLRSLSPSAGLEFNAKILPKIIRFVNIAIGLTLVFGIGLFFAVSDQLTSMQADEIYAGAGLALVTAAVAFVVTIPSFRKVIKLANDALQSGQPPSPEMRKFGARARQGAIFSAVLLLVVLVMMIASGFS